MIGVRFYLDNDDTFLIGRLGVSDQVVRLNGPIIGYQIVTGSNIRSIYFVYDNCYCDSSTILSLEADPSPLYAFIGWPLKVSFTAEHSLHNIFGGDNYCMPYTNLQEG